VEDQGAGSRKPSGWSADGPTSALILDTRPRVDPGRRQRVRLALIRVRIKAGDHEQAEISTNRTTLPCVTAIPSYEAEIADRKKKKSRASEVAVVMANATC